MRVESHPYDLVSLAYILAMSLPRGQPNASFVCVVSNPVEYKTASFDLGGVCVHGECNLPEGRSTFRAQIALRSGRSELFFPPFC